MTTFDDYEVLGILGTDLNSTCYKVRHKNDNSLYVWKAISYEQCDLRETEALQRINDGKHPRQNILLPIHDFIHHEETKTVYLIIEYCKHGSLLDLTRKCKKNGDYLHEDFIWNVLYKLSCFCKVNNPVGGFNSHEIFVDGKFDLKIFNFNLNKSNGEQSINKVNLTYLNNVLQQIIYLRSNKFPDYYSNELKNLVEFLLEPCDGVTPTIDAVLCHPTALTKINVQIDSIFINDPESRGAPLNTELTNTESFHKENQELLWLSKLETLRNREAKDKLLWLSKLENLRNREASLKKQEEKFRQQVLELDKREKKIVLNERSVKEKMMKADLYLKRARDARTSTIGSCLTAAATKKELMDNIDVSYSPDCGDLPKTSCKLNIRDLPKPPKFTRTSSTPPKFTRTSSERRVRFKPHSPLKDINNYKRETLKMQHEFKKLETVHSDSDKTSETNSDKVVMEKTNTKKKFLLGNMFSKKPSGKKLGSVGSSSDSVSAHTYEDVDKGWGGLEDCKPINWSEESKRQAFDLLRFMNSEENVNGVKHTFL